MSKSKRGDLASDEQHIFEHGTIRELTSPEEISISDEAIQKHHYLHNATLVGEHERYGFHYKGKWLAFAT